ncbi:MAG: D-aminoacylase, partial [Gammaproteobacteria bacterium]|nr:D-aminoacylase [Gammaproteobacteria bacterium]
MSRLLVFLLLVAPCALGAEAAMHHEMILRNGTLYDGGGGAPFVADLAIDGDRIAAIGDLSGRTADSDIDVEGLAVAPGFINMLSWSNLSLLQDGRSLSDIRQGVTLEVMGEGHSMGPLNEAMKQEKRENQSDIRYDVAWTTLGEYLQHLEDRGVSTNVASFVGASTVRQHVMGYEDRAASADELMQMKELVEGAMLEGAMGLSSALVYVPGNFAGTGELVELAGVAAGFDGLYTSHMRNEGKTIFDALDEFMTIVRESGIRGEIYHLKVSGKENWDKLDKVILRIEAARAEGLPVTADIYPYHASSTGLTIELPGWAKEGGQDALIERLKDPALRPKIAADMDMIPPGDLMLTNFENPALRHLIGKTLADVSAQRGTSPEETAFDLIVEDDSRVGTVRFTMSEDNIRKKIALPWVSFCSDAGALAAEGVFLQSNTHPRAYGSFARLLGRY